MWIKTKDNQCINTEHFNRIYHDPSDDCTYGTLDNGCDYCIGLGDHLVEIMRNIISGTKIMEVK